jgi:hypothetical protein
MGGVAVKASKPAKTATTDNGLLPHLSDPVDLSEISIASEGVLAKTPCIRRRRGDVVQSVISTYNTSTTVYHESARRRRRDGVQ